MKGRHAAALLCVLLTHALLLYALLGMNVTLERVTDPYTFHSEPITIALEPDEAEPPMPGVSPETPPQQPPAAEPVPPAASPVDSDAASTAITPPERVDWPIEARKSAARVLAAEAEAERIAKMFSGPDGTWASLTKRERSRIKKFRWKPGVDGLEYDEKGNAIYHISDGCVLVNLAFLACKLGKEKIHGDIFKDMKLYFDEQRLPQTNEGNGTEPESLRPAD
jgi:hypothetical protein